jgi:hypothetical protein
MLKFKTKLQKETVFSVHITLCSVRITLCSARHFQLCQEKCAWEDSRTEG